MGISKTYIPRLDLRLPAILFGLDSTAAFDSGVSKTLKPNINKTLKYIVCIVNTI